jgi:hypothetical protein
MNEQGFLEIVCNTTSEEKVRRFYEVSHRFHEKYFSLVWLARTDREDLLNLEKYEVLKRIKEIEEKYPEEVEELEKCNSNWQHGFNSGMLACIRFLESYMKDDLWPIEDTGGVECDKEEIHLVDGKEHVLMDGRVHAESLFPELDT